MSVDVSVSRVGWRRWGVGEDTYFAGRDSGSPGLERVQEANTDRASVLVQANQDNRRTSAVDAYLLDPL